MKIEITIDEKELADMVIKKLSDNAVSEIWGANYDESTETKKRRKEILEKIDWKNAGSQLSETVVQKFFTKLLDK